MGRSWTAPTTELARREADGIAHFWCALTPQAAITPNGYASESWRSSIWQADSGAEDGMYQLTYAKRASRRLLPLLYPTPDVPCLARKREVWRNFEREGGG